MVFGVHNLTTGCLEYVGEKIWSTLTDSQKKVTILATALFALISVSYLIYQCRKSFKAEKLDEEIVAKKESVKESVVDKEVEEPKPKTIPTISGHGFVQEEVAIAERLFQKLYEQRKLLDIEETLKDFLEANNINGLSNRVSVGIENKEPEVVHKGCHLHRTYYSNGMFKCYCLGFTTKFLKDFDALIKSENKEEDLNLLDFLKQVIHEMKTALELVNKKD